MNHKTLNPVMFLNYFRFFYRSILFIVVAIIVICDKIQYGISLDAMMDRHQGILAVIWLVFVIEIAIKFIPSPFESPGCQKHFKKNYIKSGKLNVEIQDNNAVVLVALFWIAFNGIFGCLKIAGIIDNDILILLCCAYSVCDMICILFFCPFQTFFLKNKCCTTCRIYNWDFAMMFTPLLFVQGIYSWSLIGLAFILLMYWEITIFKYPERFSPETNEYLHCANCNEKLCRHKKQLHTHWNSLAKYTKARISRLSK